MLVYRMDDNVKFTRIYRDFFQQTNNKKYIKDYYSIFEDVEYNKCKGWVVIDNDKAKAVFTTKIDWKQKNICIGNLIGVQYQLWYKDVLRVIEQLSSSLELKEVVIIARRGWLRFLKEYQPFQYIIKKEI
jgi:hypothetical protein